MSKYDDAISALDSERERQRVAVANAASQFNPDQYAGALVKSRETGVPAHLIAKNPEAFNRPNKYEAALDAQDAPTTQEWLSSFDNAAVAQDDRENLSGLERAMRLARKGYDFDARLRQQLNDVHASFLSGGVKAVGSTLSGAGRLLTAGRRYIDRGLRDVGLESLADDENAVAPWWAPSQLLRGSGDPVKRLGERVGVPEERKNLATDVTEGVGQLGVQALSAILTGGSITTASLFSQGADIMGERAEEAHATLEQQDRATLIGAGITALTERYGLDALLNRLPPQIKNATLRKLTDIAVGGGIEAAQEAVEGLLHNLTAKAVFDPNAPIFEGIERDATAAGGSGALARAVLGAIIPGRQVGFADQDRAVAEQIAKAAQQSKLATRSPEKLEELVSAIKQQTGSEFAYVDPAAFRTLYQSDQEAAQAAADLTGSPTTYFEAAVSNTKIAVPIEKYVARLAANKNAQSLVDHVAFTPDGLTAEEAKTERELLEGRAKEIADREVTEARPDSSQAVYDDALGQLLATGMERSTAEKNAALTQVVFRTLGQRTGMDAQKLYERYGLKIQRHIPGAGTIKRVDAAIDPLIDQLRAGDIPSPQRAFGKSMLEFIREKGGLKDEGGELAGRDVDKGGKAFQRNIIQKDGLSLDDMAERLVEAGYISERDPNLVLDLISKEIAGAPVYAAGNVNSVGAGRRAQLEWMEELASRAGIDLKTADNETIKKALGLNDERAALLDYLPSVNELTESGLAGVDEAFEVALVTRATELDAALVERLAVQYAEDDSGFIVAVRAFLNEQDTETASRSEESPGPQEGLTRYDQNSDGRPEQSARDQADQDSRRTVGGSQPAEGWQTATRIRGKSGKPLRLYRGSSRPLASTDFEDSSLGAATGHPSSGLGVFFTTDQADASRYGEVSNAYLDLRNPKLVKIEDVPAFDSIEEAIAWREKQKAAGHDGLVISASHLGGPNWAVAFRPDQVIRELEQRFDETRRGAIQFGADRQFTISLLEKADLSTYLHESGHLYLELLGDLAEDANAPQQIKDDYAAVLKWMGVKDRASIQTDQHEQWARGFESYLMEGKSPSVEMQSTFARFRAWLVSVYKTLSRLNVTLTDDVRRVMDRMVATDDEINAAEESQNYAPIFTNAEEAGMSPEEWAAYKDIATRAHEEATEEMTDRFVKQLSREQKEWWKEERAKVRDEVLAEVNQLPMYRALAFLQKGTNADGSPLPEGVQAAKLNKQALIDKYGKDFLKRLPRGLTAKAGLSADVVAGLFGFDSGDAMVEALANARPKAQLIEMEADARMREKYGDILTDGSLVEQAMQSVHTDGRAKVMAAELKALNRKRREVKPFVKAATDQAAREQRQAREANAATLPDADELRAIKAGVQRIIQGKKVRDIQPNLYRVAEAKAARKAFELAGKGKYEEAYIEKRRQILNHELYRAAAKAREEVDGIVEHMRTFDKKTTRERIAKAKGEYLEQIDALRERFDFSRVSNIADLKRTALAQWVAEQEAAGREVNVPEHLLNEARKTPYKELLLAELQGLSDAIKNIEHLAKTKDRLLKNKEAAEWETAQAELAERAQASLPEGKSPPLGRFDQTTMEAFNEKARGIADSMLRPETIVEWLDGGTQGPWHDYLWNQANESEDARDALKNRVMRPLFELSEKIDRKRRNELQEKVNIPSMARALNRRTLISIALNMGNASNLDKLQRGGYRTQEGSQAFTDQNLQEISDALTKDDWNFVQKVWDTVDQLWPDVVAFQKRMGGLAPEKVEATPVQTKHGEYRGGYFPLVYDPTVSAQGERQAAGDAVQEIMGQNFTRASTKKGHTKSRTKVARPILLDFEHVLGRHVDQVITDLTHREFVLQASKILGDAELRALIQNRIGEGAYRSLQGMVRHTVHADGSYGDPAASGWDRLQDYFIRNTAVAALGFRVVTAFGNLVLAPVQGAARIAPKNILKGLGEFYRAPRDMTGFIHERSEFMKNRAENFDASIVEVMAKLRGEKSIRAQVARAAMSVHRWADFLGTHALWLGKYRESLEAGELEATARKEADKAIRQTQTAGAPKDLSSFERDPRYKAFRMFLGPMVIMGNRIRESVGRKGVVKNWPEAFGTLMAVWFVPALLWELATGKGPDDDDGIADDAAAWALRKLFFYPFMTVPFLRDIANIAERKISGDYSVSRSVPLAEAGELVVKAGEEAFKAGNALFEGEEIDGGALAKDALRASGPLLGLPSGQLNVTGQYLYDVATGEYDPEGIGDLRYLAVKRDSE